MEDIPRLNLDFVSTELMHLGLPATIYTQHLWLDKPVSGPLGASYRPTMPRNSAILLKLTR